MSNHKKTEDKAISTTRHYVHVVAFVVFSASLGAFLMLEVYPQLLLRSAVVPPSASVTPDLESEVVYALPRALPTQLRIPSLQIDTSFEAPLGLNEGGTISVPESYENVGWYKLGASPGEIGTASILGHIDSYMGPGVFYTLGQLKSGDRVFITRADGSEAEFEVEFLERYKQSEFPTEKVYNATQYPSLRLITCSGTYEKGIARYTHNLVVYAKLVEPAR
jgi:hypothetical protein